MQILYATDGSQGSLAAAQALKRLNLRESDGIEIFVATDNGDKTDAQEQLNATQSALSGVTAHITQRLTPGPAAEEILTRAASLQPDLIILGSRGRNAVARFLLGSVAERVVCHSVCPVLVARPLRSDLHRAVVGVDGSEPSLRAVGLLQRFPLPAHCEIHLVTSLPFYPVSGTPAARVPTLAANLRQMQLQEREEAQLRLEELAASLQETGRKVTTEFRERHPAAGLLEVAEEQEADLIVMGRTGLSRIERFCMGSVSLSVLHDASCSVLIVPEIVRE